MREQQYPATAIILAGGKSSRLGFDKQLLEYKGHYLIDLLLGLLSPIFAEVVLVSNTPALHRGRGCRVVGDTLPGAGPLGGLQAGLEAARYPLCYVTACDMPWISMPYIRFLLEYHRQHPGAEAIVTRLGEMLEPMNALYAKTLADTTLALLERQQRKMTALLDVARTVYIPEATARRYSPDWGMFDNINTPADWQRYVGHVERRQTGDQNHTHHPTHP